LDFEHHQYTATEVDRNGLPVNAPAVDPPRLRQSGVKVRVIVETRDTGETRQMFGYTARHFVTTRKEFPAAGACAQPQESTEDGWYIDVEEPTESCMAKRPQRSTGVAVLVAGNGESACIDDYEVERIGPAVPPFALEVTRTSRQAVAGARTMTSEELVSDFSRLPLDPQIFDLPTGYKHVDELDQSPSLPYLLRAKLMWQSVKTTVWGWTPWGR